MKNQLFILVSLIILISSCAERDGDSARLQVALVDAPADYQAVYVDIQDVLINPSEDEPGWETMEGFNPGVFNLLDLTNGNEVLLGDMMYPEGKLGQIRLVLGDGNSLQLEGGTVELKVPSGSESGLKIKINEELVGGVTYKLILDFDAARSVVKTGSEKYILKPVIRAAMEAQSGAISGVVDPTTKSSLVYAINETDSMATYTEEGSYLIKALPAGIYDVVAVSQSETGDEDISVSGIEVLVGEVTKVDTLKFQ